jgi:hypothetical protein
MLRQQLLQHHLIHSRAEPRTVIMAVTLFAVSATVNAVTASFALLCCYSPC